MERGLREPRLEELSGYVEDTRERSALYPWLNVS